MIDRWMILVALSGLACAHVRAQGLFEVTPRLDYPLDHPSSALAVADLDGDGLLDAAVTHAGDARLSVLLLRAEGPPAMASHEVGLSPLHLTSGDLDQSGTLDLVTVNSGSSSLSVLLNRGAGVFADPAEVRVTGAPRAAWIIDLDGDGSLDAAAISEIGRAHV